MEEARRKKLRKHNLWTKVERAGGGREGEIGGRGGGEGGEGGREKVIGMAMRGGECQKCEEGRVLWTEDGLKTLER